MSVINDMLRNLEQRQAQLDAGAAVVATGFARPRRRRTRWSWGVFLLLLVVLPLSVIGLTLWKPELKQNSTISLAATSVPAPAPAIATAIELGVVNEVGATKTGEAKASDNRVVGAETTEITHSIIDEASAIKPAPVASVAASSAASSSSSSGSSSAASDAASEADSEGSSVGTADKMLESIARADSAADKLHVVTDISPPVMADPVVRVENATVLKILPEPLYTLASRLSNVSIISQVGGSEQSLSAPSGKLNRQAGNQPKLRMSAHLTEVNNSRWLTKADDAELVESEKNLVGSSYAEVNVAPVFYSVSRGIAPVNNARKATKRQPGTKVKASPGTGSTKSPSISSQVNQVKARHPSGQDLRIKPAEDDRQRLLALRRLQNGDFAAAEGLLATVTAAQKKSPELTLLAAQLAFAKGKKSHAVRILAADPPPVAGNEGYYQLWAAVAFQQSDYAAAESLYQQLLAHQPDDSRSLMGLAFSMKYSGKRSLAKPVFQRALRGNGLTANARNLIVVELSELLQ